MNFKKLLILLLAVVLLGAMLCACGDDEDEDGAPEGGDKPTETVEPFTVSCYINGTGSEPTALLVLDGAINITELPSRTGYTFLGLFDAPTGGGMVMDAQGVSLVVVKQGMVLYAQWSPNSYKIVFDGRGGTLSENGSEMTVAYDAALTKFPTAEKVGHVFLGWEDSAGTRYSDKAAVLQGKQVFNLENYAPEGDTVTLFAVFELAKYTVTFDYNDGTYRSTTATVTHGQTVPDSMYPTEGVDTGTRRVYAWAMTANGAQSFMGTVTSDITLYAIWKDYRSFTLSDTVGGETVVIVYRDEPLDLLTYDGVTRPGFDLEGWYTSVQYAGNPVTEITYTSTVKIYYARWTVATYSLVFDQASAGKAIDPISYQMGDTVALENINREGLIFKGWSVVADGSGKTFTTLPADFWGNHTLYAIFEPVFFDVTLWSDGGMLTSGNGVVSVGYSKSYQLPVPEKTGHTFLGWFDGTGTDAQPLTGVDGASLAPYDVIGKSTAYARWTPKTYTVTFQTAGGSAVAPLTVTHGKKLTLPTAPTLEGKVFGGWYTDEALETPLAASYRVTADLTLYAHWLISNPISTAEELLQIANAPEANYHLTRDINLGGGAWATIAEYSGVLDGRGYKIHNFTTTAGLIALNKGTVKNLTVSDFSLTSAGGGYNVAVLVAANEGKIYGCSVTDGVMTVKGSGEANGIDWTLCSGAICGYSSGEIVDCSAAKINMTVDALAYNPYKFYSGKMYYTVFMGGLVGRSGGIVSDSYADCVLSASASAYATAGPGGAGSVATNTVIMGGLLGRNDDQGTCKMNESVGSTTFASIGYKGFNGVINAYVGGLLGQNLGTATDCVAKGRVENISGGLNAGGAGGLLSLNYKTVMNSYADAYVKTNAVPVGGFVHQNEGTISNCYSLGTLETTNAGVAMGGFVGINNVGGSINKCLAAGNMIGVGAEGIASFVAAEGTSSSYFKCYYREDMTVAVSDIATPLTTYNGEAASADLIKTEGFLYYTLAWTADAWCVPADGYPVLTWQAE